MTEDVDDGIPREWERSTDFAKPWRITKHQLPTKYGRFSYAIVDAYGKVVLFIDPSQGEYAMACNSAAALKIIEVANAS